MKPSELLNSPEKWTKGAFARNNKNEIIEYFEEGACRFCVWGVL